MHPFIKEFKYKVDEIIQDNALLNAQTEKFKTMKKEDITLDEYKQQAESITKLKDEISKKTYSLYSLHAPKILQKLGWDAFLLGEIFEYNESFGNGYFRFNIDLYTGSGKKFLKSLFKRITGTNFQEQFAKSIYISLVHNFGDEYYKPVSFSILTEKDLSQNETSQENLIKLIMKKQCILLNNDILYENSVEGNKVDNKLTNYVFDYDMLSEEKSIYDQLYPTLRNTVWQMIDENFTHTLDKMIVGCKNGLVKAEEKFNEYKETNESNLVVLNGLKNGDSDALSRYETLEEDEENEEEDEDQF